MDQPDPYASFRDDAMPSNLLTVVRQLVDLQEEKAAEVEYFTQALKDAKDILRNMQEVEIPTALEGLTGKFDLKDGRVLEVGQKSPRPCRPSTRRSC